MSDEELIARLRAVCTCNIDSTPCMAEDDCRDALTAADRIEALLKDRDSLLAGHRALNIGGARLQDRAETAEARAERLEEALMAMRKRAMSTRGEQAYRELPVFIIRASSAALKGDDHV